ncbi:MAG TPA: septum formation initiator family protein [Candidatus Binataceae bacterium]|jgi:cell division protein FtsB|nr:septum formation initiator family protein [Candidatus Binataceae bacterium]
MLGAILLALTVNFLIGREGMRDFLKLAAFERSLNAENLRLSAANAALQTQSNRLRNDDAYVQALIRTELGYSRPDEITYRFSSETHPRN